MCWSRLEEQRDEENKDPELCIENKLAGPRNQVDIEKFIHRLNAHSNDEDGNEMETCAEMFDEQRGEENQDPELCRKYISCPRDKINIMQEN